MKAAEIEIPKRKPQVKKSNGDEIDHPLEKWLRMDRIPHIWCSTCGIGTAVTCFIEAVKKAAVENRLSCAQAYALAEELQVSLGEIGALCNELGITIPVAIHAGPSLAVGDAPVRGLLGQAYGHARVAPPAFPVGRARRRGPVEDAVPPHRGEHAIPIDEVTAPGSRPAAHSQVSQPLFQASLHALELRLQDLPVNLTNGRKERAHRQLPVAILLPVGGVDPDTEAAGPASSQRAELVAKHDAFAFLELTLALQRCLQRLQRERLFGVYPIVHRLWPIALVAQLQRQPALVPRRLPKPLEAPSGRP